ncbi:MAG: hypothetical protein II139_04305 [Lachnospiraceae bacterium]|nr:hypothetical protein [Lachnospiraceae bacterium]
MVSRRNFFTMLILLMIMIFMFMFSSVLKQVLNEYGTNSYAQTDADEGRLRGDYDALSAKLSDEAKALSGKAILPDDYDEGDADKRVIFLCRGGENEVGKVVNAWCGYMKRPMITYNTLDGLEYISSSALPEVIIVDGENVNWNKEADRLLHLTQNGACVIFARMPQPKEIKNSAVLRELMGIKDVYSEKIAIDGIRLFPGFFIGTEEEYADGPGKEGRQDLKLTLPWYVTGEASKVYMMGIVNDRSRKSQFLPSIVWRHAYGDGKCFCITGDYLTEMSGMGFLTACLGEKDSYDIYPVINAQNLVLANYGGFSDENGDALEAIYDQRQIPLFRDVVGPSVISMTERSKDKISLMVTPQMDYEDDIEPEDNMLVFYLRLLNEGYGEAGLSTKQISNLSLAQKLGKDRVYWEREAADYVLRSLYLDDATHYEDAKALLPDLRTIVIEEKNAKPVTYVDDEVTCQVATSDCLTHTFSQDIALKSLETALGYSNVVFDMFEVSHPSGDDYADFSRKTSSNLLSFWKPYAGFAKTTLSESDLRIRRFMALDYHDARKGSEITLHVDNFDKEAFFILKLNRDEIDEVEGATITDLGDGFFLLGATQEDVKITVKVRTLYYY